MKIKTLEKQHFLTVRLNINLTVANCHTWMGRDRWPEIVLNFLPNYSDKTIQDSKSNSSFFRQSSIEKT